MKLVHWPTSELVGQCTNDDGWTVILVQRRGAWTGSQPAQTPPWCTYQQSV